MAPLKKLKMSTSSPFKMGAKVVPMAAPTTTKRADNTTKRTAQPNKRGK